MTEPAPPAADAALPAQLSKCLSIDLEMGKHDGELKAMAAYRPDTGKCLHYRGNPTPQQWQDLEAMADSAEFLVGHNLIAFDAPHLHALNPSFSALYLPRVDTLMLNPLAFPRNPYHHLVKHYKDGGLERTSTNDPLLDSQLAVQALANQVDALSREDPTLLTALHGLTTLDGGEGFDTIFRFIRGKPRPDSPELQEALQRLLANQACQNIAMQTAEDPAQPWPLTFILAWLPAAGGSSVIAPWVFHQYPETATLLKKLRDAPCGDPGCAWCSERHDAKAQLKRWFGFEEYRPLPATADGASLQETITAQAMAGQDVLGILPTGTGKSVCYQVPALSRYDATGALTVVISPLQALMQDQVTSLENQGILGPATLNGMLTPPQRSAVIRRVREGDISILLLSPEQLRSRPVADALSHRQIAAWVLDEAHCLSKWGHDFRPDYRYIGRFISAFHAGGQDRPPITCLTATAKPDVTEEIVDYFRQTAGTALNVLDGGATRRNLDFRVIPASRARKMQLLLQTVKHHLPDRDAGGAIVYCATRTSAEETASWLEQNGITAEAYHSKVAPDTKQQVQQRFAAGDTQVVAATNAFGMGIDKPDVRLVLHRDMPGSLENYLQEAGRAGRDNEAAHCVLLYDPEDAERQHSMASGSRLSRQDIQAVLRALRNLHKKNNRHAKDQPVIATAGEILQQDEEGEISQTDGDDRTRIATAISWLEETKALQRTENRTSVYPSSLQVPTLEAAESRMKNLPPAFRSQLMTIVRKLIQATPTEGITTDELAAMTGMNLRGVRRALNELHQMQILQDNQPLTAFVAHGVANASRARMQQASHLEDDLLKHLQEQAPDQAIYQAEGYRYPVYLSQATQQLKNQGHPTLIPHTLLRTLKGIAETRHPGDSARRNLRIRTRKHGAAELTLLTDWASVQEAATIRRETARVVLAHLLSKLPPRVTGTDLLVATTMGELAQAMAQEMFAGQGDIQASMHQALLWLHEQEIVRLHSGAAVIRPAMTIHLGPPGQDFTAADYQPLKLHYEDKTHQIHIIARYAETALERVADALRLVNDYFTLPKDAFIHRWLPNEKDDISRATTPQSWHRIVGSLDNRQQASLVADENTSRNTLVLAGPGSGKTRMLVHRIAYLVRVMREPPSSIIALAYNRHAAAQIRARLRQLIGYDGAGVTVLTCHAMAMKLTGSTFTQHADETDTDAQDRFRKVLVEAAELLEGSRNGGMDPEDQRDRLLQGYRWILVDEYQDIGADEYRLISALAGRTQASEDAKLSLLAVGDDDQNIYSFTGTSNRYIRSFQEDYRARTTYLTQNYRSSGHIISAANAVIGAAADRMKKDNPITVNRARRSDDPGGAQALTDAVTRGRVQILPAGPSPQDQAVIAVQELQRLLSLEKDTAGTTVAVIARHWATLEPFRIAAEHAGLSTRLARENFRGKFNLRETRTLLDHAKKRTAVSAAELMNTLRELRPNTWTEMLQTALEDLQAETGDEQVPASQLEDTLAEWLRASRDSPDGILLSTAHSAKGLEFDHVMILDGGWTRGRGPADDKDSDRRLYYVAMTRARRSLTLLRQTGARNPFIAALDPHPAVLTRQAPLTTPEIPPNIGYTVQKTGQGDVYLGFAGEAVEETTVHRAIAELSPGDPLQVRRSGRVIQLLDSSNRPVAQMARDFKPVMTTKAQARVYAITRWGIEKTDPKYRHRYHANQWEVVIPEFYYPPE